LVRFQLFCTLLPLLFSHYACHFFLFLQYTQTIMGEGLLEISGEEMGELSERRSWN
jgi:hypothetical protein